MRGLKAGNVKIYGYLFLIPYFVVFAIFGLYPLVYTFFLSFHSWDGFSNLRFVGIHNYARLFSDPIFYMSIKNTLRIWIVNFVPQITIALFLANAFTNNKVKGMSTFRAIFYLPNLITATSIGLLFNLFFNGDFSMFNQLLLKMHIIETPMNWFGNRMLTSLTVSYIQWWMWFGYSLIIIMAGLTGIDGSYYEAAMVDGSTKWQVFKYITLPLLRPTVIYLTITSMIGGLQLFDVPMVLTDGMGSPAKSILTTSMYIYNQGFKYNNYGYASSVAYGLFIVIALLAVLSFQVIKGKEK